MQRAIDAGHMTPQFMAILRGATAAQLRGRIRRVQAQEPAVTERRAEAEARPADQHRRIARARFDHTRDEGGGVSSRWNGNDPPDPVEIQQARMVAAATGEPVVLYGNSFAGVDGTIGNPPRLLQLKAAPDAATLVHVIATAKQNAQTHGDRGLEVHVDARGLTLAQAAAVLQATPVTPGAWLRRVTIHVAGGAVELQSSGHL